MIRLAIVVEGETEEEFVNSVLVPHLHTHGVWATPHPLGGNITVDRLASELVRYLWSYDRVTSLVDFYGFRNKGKASREDLQTRIFQQVDARIKVSWDQSRVIPYVQQSEFTALLFSCIEVFKELPDCPPNLLGWLYRGWLAVAQADRSPRQFRLLSRWRCVSTTGRRYADGPG